MSSKIFTTEPAKPFAARRANDYIVDTKPFRAPEMLFDEFWREGELALLFGPPASGKSVFAVQLADALSRGAGLYGFRTPRARRRVLYVDLRHTDEQFRLRCIGEDASRRHKFPQNLFRERPPVGEDLCEWLRETVTRDKMQVVIIDDLAALKNTHDGTRETLALMRRLRELRDELNISILAITDSSEPKWNRAVSESDLGRSRVLSTVADSVFAVGRGLRSTDDHYLIQTRARAARLYWTPKNAPFAHITRNETGLLAFEFDRRFSKELDPKQRQMICEIAHLRHTAALGFREIAAQLGISKSWAMKLYKKWTPGMGSGQWSVDSGQSADQEKGQGSEQWTGNSEQFDEEENDRHGDGEFNDDGEWGEYFDDGYGSGEDGRQSVPPAVAGGAFCQAEEVLAAAGIGDGRQSVPPAVAGGAFGQADDAVAAAGMYGPLLKSGRFYQIPWAAGLGRRSIYDLQRGVNGYGREIFIESAEHISGRPIVWYAYDDKGILTRHKRDLYGISLTRFGKTEWV